MLLDNYLCEPNELTHLPGGFGEINDKKGLGNIVVAWEEDAL